MLLPVLVGKNPRLLASGVSGDFGGPAEARSKDDLEGKGGPDPCGVVVCVCVCFLRVLGRNGRNGMKMDMTIFGCRFMGA